MEKYSFKIEMEWVESDEYNGDRWEYDVKNKDGEIIDSGAFSSPKDVCYFAGDSIQRHIDNSPEN